MRSWKAKVTIGSILGVVLTIAALSATVTLGLGLGRVLDAPPEQWQINLTLYRDVVIFLALAITTSILAYRSAAALTLRYQLDRNGLYITWLGNRAVAPLDQIQRVDVGAPPARIPWHTLWGFGWYSGQTQIDDKTLYLFSTQSPSRSLAIHINNAVYIISPAEVEAFVQDLEQRRNLGATKPLAPTIESGRIFQYDFWNDSTVRILLLLAFTLNLLIFALLAARYPALAPQIEMRFNAAGEVAELRPRHQALFLPLAACCVSLLNIAIGLFLYRTQQIGARLLQGASVLVQLLFGVAVGVVIR
jgi:hypothetical protein